MTWLNRVRPPTPAPQSIPRRAASGRPGAGPCPLRNERRGEGTIDPTDLRHRRGDQHPKLSVNLDELGSVAPPTQELSRGMHDVVAEIREMTHRTQTPLLCHVPKECPEALGASHDVEQVCELQLGY